MTAERFLFLFFLTLMGVPWAPVPILVAWALFSLFLGYRWARSALQVLLRPWFLGSLLLLVLGMAVVLPAASPAVRLAWMGRFLLRALILVLWLQMLRHRVSPAALVQLLRRLGLKSLAPLLTLSLFLLPRLMEDLQESWALFTLWVPSRRQRLLKMPHFLGSVVVQAARIAHDLTLALTLLRRPEE